MACNISTLGDIVESLASELAKSIQTNDTMIEELKSLSDDDQYHKDRENVRRKFNELLTQCFSSYPENGNNESKFKISAKLNPPHKYYNKFTLFLLEKKFKDMKEQEDDLKLELDDLLFNDLEINDPYLISLNRKHKLIKNYYLPNSSKHVLSMEAGAVDSVDLIVKTKFGLKNRIREMMIERRNETVKAQAQGLFSFIDLLFLDQEDEFITISCTHSAMIEIGKHLCFNLCDLMFIISENSLLYGKWNLLKEVVKLLMQYQQKHTSVMRRFHFVIEKAEKELKKLFEPFDDDDDDEDDFSVDDENKIDQTFDMIFKEALYLDSILSYPYLSLSKLNIKKELRGVMNGVQECSKQMDKIRTEVGDLKTNLLSENANITKMKLRFDTVIRVWINIQWSILNDEP
ncbi:hypothetical protein CsatA_018665 [Cannabis sativa]